MIQKPKHIPTFLRRLSMIFLRVFGDLISEYILKSYFIRPLVEEYFHPKLSSQTIELLSRFLITSIEKIHKIYFYLTGTSYNISKTLTNIHYLIYTRSTSDSLIIESKLKSTMKLLSLCLCIQHLIECYISLKQISISITQHRHQLNLLADKENEKKIITTDNSIIFLRLSSLSLML